DGWYPMGALVLNVSGSGPWGWIVTQTGWAGTPPPSAPQATFVEVAAPRDGAQPDNPFVTWALGQDVAPPCAGGCTITTTTSTTATITTTTRTTTTTTRTTTTRHPTTTTRPSRNPCPDPETCRAKDTELDRCLCRNRICDCLSAHHIRPCVLETC